jgi:hypothetical protein
MVVSESPMNWDFARWRGVLENYMIDGKPQFEMANVRDREAVYTITHQFENGSPETEDCRSILSRTAAINQITDDNMGTEWRFYLGLE